MVSQSEETKERTCVHIQRKQTRKGGSAKNGLPKRVKSWKKIVQKGTKKYRLANTSVVHQVNMIITKMAITNLCSTLAKTQ